MLPSTVGARPIVIYPHDRTAVTTANINIHGAITERVEVVRLTINGQLMVPFVRADRTFVQSARLRPGVNEIAVGDETFLVAFVTAKSPSPEGFRKHFLHLAIDQGCANCHDFASPGDFSANAPAREMCLGCHGDPSRGVGGVAQPFGHSPASDDGDCLACHAPHVGDTRSMNIKPLPDLCYDCHDPVSKGLPRVHDPVGSGECTSCHGPHGAPEAKLLLEKGDELCLACHDDPAAGLPVQHDALGDDGCSLCHTPHASKYRGLLVSAEVQLCGQCHDEGATPVKGLKVHSPISDDGECTVCHQPHGSMLARLLSAKPAELCAQCHDDMTAAGQKGGSIHPPAEEGGCPDCHDPHSGPSALLSKSGSQLCLDCHDAFVKPDKGSLHSPIEDGACSDCHASHSSPRKSLLKAAGADLCYSCHDPFSGPMVHSPVSDGDCLSCHLSHSSPNSALLQKRGMDLCLDCHEDPTLVQFRKPDGSVHSPIADDRECLPCHRPHSGDKALLAGKVTMLCEGCHGDVTKKDPKTRFQYIHTPVADGDCLQCHTPHASSVGKLMLYAGNRDFCLQCHSDPGVKAGSGWAVPHPPVLQDCVTCHTAHASDVKGNLVRPQGNLCRQCHKSHDGHRLDGSRAISGSGTMVKLPAGFPVREDGEMICGGCHLVHGSDYEHMFHSPKDWFCRNCHSF